MKISIVGGGSFGTALAQVLSYYNDILLIVRDEALSENINTYNINNNYFPNFVLNKNIKSLCDYSELSKSDVIILALPAKIILGEVVKIKKNINDKTILINTAKGFSSEKKTILRSLKKLHKNSFSILGPTFADNLIKNEYSAFTIASSKKSHFLLSKEIFNNTNIILDYSKNYRLIEMASILKNVFAIANGLYSAIDDSVNTKYAFLTQSYKEMNFILKFLFKDISNDYYKNGVFGDLLLTSLNDQSRNKTLGQLIGRGFYNINNNSSSVTLEGIKSTKIIYKIVEKNKINTPIVSFVYKVLKGNNVYEEYKNCMENIRG